MGYDWGIHPIYKGIVLGLVLNDAHLCVCVVLEIEIVAVKMVRSYVEKHRNVCAEVIHVVQLERRQFYYVVVEVFLCHLKRKAATDVSCKSHIKSRRLQNMIYKRCGCGFSVAAGDANHLGVGVTSCKFYFGNDVYSFFFYFPHNGSFLGNAGAFYHFGRRED